MAENYNEFLSGPNVQERLDDFFKSDEKNIVNSEIELYAVNYPLNKLKSLILSIDWEITNATMTDFLMLTDSLINFYRHDKVILNFLNILRAVGSYIDLNRSKANPESFKILNSVFFALDTVRLKRDMPQSEKEKMLKIEIEKYKQLRHVVSNRKLTKSVKKGQFSLIKIAPKVVESDIIDCCQPKSQKKMLVVSQKQLNDLKNDIIQFIHSEFIDLKNELNNSKCMK